MKTKIAILSIAILAGIGATTAIAGRDWNYTPASDKAPVAEKAAPMGCCSMGGMKMAEPTDKSAGALSCHSAKDGAAAEHKSCCK